MRSENQQGIVVKVLDANGGLLRTQELEPLLAPLRSILVDIRAKGGPAIEAERVQSCAQEFPLLLVHGVPVACMLAAERTDDDGEAHWLWTERHRGLSQAFHDLSRDEWRSADRLAASPSLARAAFVLTGILETAMITARTGAVARKIGDLTFIGSPSALCSAATRGDANATTTHAIGATLH